MEIIYGNSDNLSAAISPITTEHEIIIDKLKLEVLKLKQQVGFWKGQHKQAKKKIAKLEKSIKSLNGKIKKLTQTIFGKKSEKGKGAETSPKDKKPGKRGQKKGSKGHGRTPNPSLSVREEVIDLEESEKFCSICGVMHEEMDSTEDSDVTEVEVDGYTRRRKRKKYKKGCECEKGPQIITAPLPKDKVIPGGKYANSFWILVLLNKFLWHIPSNRFLQQLLSIHLKVSPGTITGGMKKLSPLFKEISESIQKQNRQSNHWHADETRWMVFVEVPGKANHKWWLWVFRSGTSVVFKVCESRGAIVPEEHYGDEAYGVISADRYGGYKTLLKTGRFLIAFCWIHVRRDFLGEVTAQQGTPFEEWATEWVRKISKLFKLNKERLKYSPDSKEFLEYDQKLRSAIEAIKQDYIAQLKDETLKLPKSCKKRLNSLQNHWSGLILFLDYPWIPMENNSAERTIRGPVIGRNGYYGSGSLWSAELTANLWTILFTLSMWGINQKLWLEDFFLACAKNGGNAPENINQYLPWNMSDEELIKYGSDSSKRPHEKAKLSGRLSELKDNLNKKDVNKEKEIKDKSIKRPNVPPLKKSLPPTHFVATSTPERAANGP